MGREGLADGVTDIETHVRRPPLMWLAGRSGQGYIAILAALCVLLAVPTGGVPVWVAPIFAGWFLFEYVGGVRISGGTIRCRQFVRMVNVPIESIASVNAYPANGPSGAFPTVTLNLHDGTQVNVLAMTTISRNQARREAHRLAELVGAEPPSENWDGT